MAWMGPYAMTLANSAVTAASIPNDLMQFVTTATATGAAMQFLEARVGFEGSVTSTMTSAVINQLSTAATTGTAVGTTYVKIDPYAPNTTLQSGTALTGTLMTVAGAVSAAAAAGILAGPWSFNLLMGYLWQPVLENRPMLAAGGAVTTGTASFRIPRVPNPSSTLNYDLSVMWLEGP